MRIRTSVQTDRMIQISASYTRITYSRRSQHVVKEMTVRSLKLTGDDSAGVNGRTGT
jgi:hypothetical protein